MAGNDGRAAKPPNETDTPMPPPGAPPPRRVGRLRAKIPRWQSALLGALSVACILAVWWFLTRGERAEDRIVPPGKLPSVTETFASFESLWFNRALTRNTCASLLRVVLGFGLAALVGVPLGVVCGCFPRVTAFFAPLTIFGRNIPMAALIPLSFLLFGIDELQKVMFIFIAAVAFIVFDSAQAIRDIPSRYIDTAYTLGAARRQVIMKVLVPLAMPSIFNSLRLLFGLAFGYIMLAEVIQVGGVSGLGGIINNSFRRGPKEHIYLVLLIIPVIALVIDRVLYWIQVQLFPYRYGSSGLLARFVRFVLHGWEHVTGWCVKPSSVVAAMPGAASTGQPAGSRTAVSAKGQSGPAQPEPVQPGPLQSETKQPEPERPEPERPEPERPEPEQPEPPTTGERSNHGG